MRLDPNGSRYLENNTGRKVLGDRRVNIEGLFSDAQVTYPSEKVEGAEARFKHLVGAGEVNVKDWCWDKEKGDWKCNSDRAEWIKENAKMETEPFGSAALTGWPYSVEKKDEPYGRQIGGDHYSKYPIQPTEYIIKNNLNFCEGNVIKYVTRWKDKGGVEDLKKARHYLDMLIEEVSK
jgi:hypothetical protein